MKTIWFHDIQDPELSFYLDVTEEEWERLIKPCEENNWPLDASTVDQDLMEELYKRERKQPHYDEILHIC